MSLRQAKIITAAIALTIGGALVIAKPPANADLPRSASQVRFLGQATEQPPEQPFRQRGLDGGKLMKQLNLSEGQKQKISAIRQQYQGQTQQLWEKIRTERQKLYDMMAGTATETEIRRQHQQVAQIDQQIHNLRFESMLETRQVLTPDQRRQFAQLMQQRRGQFKHSTTDKMPVPRSQPAEF